MLGEPKGKNGFQLFLSRNVMQGIKNLFYREVLIGKNIALAGLAVFHAGKDTVGYIPHVHKIIAALHAGGEPAVQIVDHQLGQMAPAKVARP